MQQKWHGGLIVMAHMIFVAQCCRRVSEYCTDRPTTADRSRPRRHQSQAPTHSAPPKDFLRLQVGKKQLDDDQPALSFEWHEKHPVKPWSHRLVVGTHGRRRRLRKSTCQSISAIESSQILLRASPCRISSRGPRAAGGRQCLEALGKRVCAACDSCLRATSRTDGKILKGGSGL